MGARGRCHPSMSLQMLGPWVGLARIGVFVLGYE